MMIFVGYDKYDRVVLLLSLVVALAFLGFLFKIENQEVGMISIGKVTANGSEARRKTSESFAWNNFSKISNIGFGDSIFTGENTTASVTIPSVGKIEMESLSMISFSKLKETPYLEFLYGEVVLKDISTDSKVMINNHLYILRNKMALTTLKLRKIKDSESELSVTHGDVDLIDNETKTVNTISDSSIIKFKDSNISDISGDKSKVEIITPVENQKIDALLNNYVSIKINKTYYKYFQIQVANDQNFNVSVIKYELSKSGSVLHSIGESGIFYIRAMAYDYSDRKYVISKIVKFEVINGKKHEDKILETPILTQTKFLNINDSKENIFEVLKTNNSYKYEFQLAVDNTFFSPKTVVLKKNIYSNNNFSRNYYMRVRYFDGSIYSDWSNVLSVKNVPNKIIIGSIPETTITDSTSKEINLKWTKTGFTNKYNLIISQDEKFSSFLGKASIKGDTFQYMVNNDGIHFFKVVDSEDSENFGLLKVVIHLNTTLLKPVLTVTKITESELVKRFDFKWTKDTRSDKSIVEFSNTKDFYLIKLSKDVLSDSLSLEKGALTGKMYCRVRTVRSSTSDETLSEYKEIVF